jgi:predicted dehydrogenase
VIGCGVQGQIHMRAYRACSGAEVVAVCDTDPARVEEAGRAFGVAGRFADYRALLAGAACDLVSVCTMPASHREIAVAALDAGAHVLCEKPTALDAGEAAAMVAAARRADRFLTVGFNMRFLPAAQALRRFVAEGGLGRPLYTRAWTLATDIPWWGTHYVKAVSGGGVLASTAVHILDLALWVAGQTEPVAVSASMTRVFPRKRATTAPSAAAAARFDVEDLFSGHLRFGDGSWMTLEAGWGWDRPGPSYSFEMVGERAAIRFDPFRIVAERDGVPVDVTPADADRTPPQEGWFASVAAEIDDVVAAVRDGRAPLVRAEEALRVQRLVDALYLSATTGREVRLEDEGRGRKD